jgi:hypothetical protein
VGVLGVLGISVCSFAGKEVFAGDAAEPEPPPHAVNTVARTSVDAVLIAMCC